MVDLTTDELKTIKKFASHPSGLGYVLNYSNNSFSNWFRDNWNVDIDGSEFTNGELSKGDRLLAFCTKSSAGVVVQVLRQLHQEAMDLDIKASNQVPLNTVASFEELLGRLESEASLQSISQNKIGLSKNVVLHNSKQNGASIVLVVSGTIERLAEFREIVRSDNSLSATNPEIKNRLLKLLDALSVHLEALLNLIPMSDQDMSAEQEDDLVSWTDRYVNAALPKLKEYVSPEALGRTSVPAGLILLCGGVGSLLTGFSPLGFGAGSVVGKMLVGEIKSGTVVDKLQDSFPDDK